MATVELTVPDSNITLSLSTPSVVLSTGTRGPAGPGVPTGGTTGQVLSKVDGTDYNTEWADAATGDGDVVGPASATNGNIALFDGTTGKLLQDGPANNSTNWNTAYGWGDHSTAGYQAEPSEGPFVDGDKTKLDGIESGATADQTGAEIKVAYEGEADTNAFTDAEKTKLAGIATGADVGDVTAASSFGTDETIIRADGTGKGVQTSIATIDDSGNLKTTGTLSVGTTTNPYQLTVRKDQAAPTQFGVGNYTSGGSSGFRLDAFGSHYVINLLYGTGAYYLYTNASMIIGTYAAKDVIFYSNTTDRGRIHSTGEWSIGTATKSAMLSVNGPARVGQYTVATVPSASTNGAGSIIYVSDEVGGACLAFSDGTNWKRAHDPATTIS